MKHLTVFYSQASMGTLEVLFPIFFSSLLTTLVTGQDICTTHSRCSESEPTVHIPFSLEGDEQARRCGYEGFHLYCDEKHRTVIQLDTWGEFLVRNINYTTQEVQIYDQNNCLPKRFLDIPSPGSFFGDIEFGLDRNSLCNYASQFSSNDSVAKRCLSTSDYSEFFTYINRICSNDLWRSAIVPPWPFYKLKYSLDGDFHLTWLARNCGPCVKQGGQCGFMNTMDFETICFFPSRRRGVSRTVKALLGIGVGIPLMIIVVLAGCYIYGRFRSNGSNNNIAQTSNHQRRHVELSASALPAPAILVVGLDETVIQSYTKTVLGESLRLPKPDDNNCSICLSEYRPKETLKTIPECKHCFHAACIDEWLRRNVTCPLCRNFPV